MGSFFLFLPTTTSSPLFLFTSHTALKYKLITTKRRGFELEFETSTLASSLYLKSEGCLEPVRWTRAKMQHISPTCCLFFRLFLKLKVLLESEKFIERDHCRNFRTQKKKRTEIVTAFLTYLIDKITLVEDQYSK